MSLSREFLEAMGLTKEQVSAIVKGNSDSLSGLTTENKNLRDENARLKEIEKEFNNLKAANSGKEDLQKSYDALKAEYEQYKSDITAKETRAAKETALKAYFEKNNIVGKNQAIAMRGIKSELDGIELDEKGNIKDTASLDELVKGDYAGLISTTKTEGAHTSTPPNNTGGNTFETMTLTEKMRYANAHPDDASVKAFLGS